MADPGPKRSGVVVSLKVGKGSAQLRERAALHTDAASPHAL
jgi:hypothetical protein